MPACSEVMADNNDKCITGNGTGVFIPQCILDGSALSNPAIFNRPHRKRRGSGHAAQSDSKHSSSKQTQKQQQQPEAQQPKPQQGSPAAATSSTSGGTATAKNPFAATPRNIRQQQLLCNLVAAADCFSEATAAAGAAPLPPTASRGPSLDLTSLPMGHAGLACGAAVLPPAGGNSRASLDMARSGSRTSLDSYYYQRSMDVNSARTSIEQSCRSSIDCRYSIDRSSLYSTGLYSSRPSTESTFSCFAPASAAGARNSLDLGPIGVSGQGLGYNGGYNAAGGAAYPMRQSAWPSSSGRPALDLGQRPSLDVGHRASIDLAARPLAAAAPQQQQQRCSLDVSAITGHGRLSFDVAAQNGQRVSLDNSDCSEAFAWQQLLQQQQQHRGLVRRDNSDLSSNSTVCSTPSSSDCRLPSPAAATAAAPGADVMAAAALAAQQAAAAAGAWDASMQAAVLQQLQQQLLLEQLAGSSARAAAGLEMAQLLRQGSDGSNAGHNMGNKSMASPVATGLPPAAPIRPVGSSSNSDVQQELNLIQQQLQQIVQANQMAAAAAASNNAAAAARAASLQQMQTLQLQQQMQTAVLQRLLEQQQQQQGASEVVAAEQAAAAAANSSSLDAAVSAASLQQQLEMLQMLQL